MISYSSYKNIEPFQKWKKVIILLNTIVIIIQTIPTIIMIMCITLLLHSLFPLQQMIFFIALQKNESRILCSSERTPAVFRLSANFRSNSEIRDPPLCSSSFFLQPLHLMNPNVWSTFAIATSSKGIRYVFWQMVYSFIKIHLRWSLRNPIWFDNRPTSYETLVCHD